MDESDKSSAEHRDRDLHVHASRLRELCLRYSPSKPELPQSPRDAGTGEIWSTKPRATFPPNLPEQFQTDEPLWILILDSEPIWVNGHRLFHVAPIFSETELIGPRDVPLPIGILGFECAVAMDMTLTILEDSLETFQGRLADVILQNLVAFRDEILSTGTSPDSVVCTGSPYVGPNDVRVQFHERLAQRLDYLWEPVALAIETIPIDFPEREPRVQTFREAVEEILEAVRTGVRQLTTIEWLPTFERQLQPVGLQAAEERRQRHEKRYLAPSENLTITVTAQAIRGPDVRFQVFGQTGELSSRIDGAVIIDADGNTSAPLMRGETRMNPQQLERGFVIVKPDGGILDLEPEQ